MQSQSIQNKWSISFISSHVSDAELIHGAHLRGFAPVVGHKYKVFFLISSSHSLFHNPGYMRDFNPLVLQGFIPLDTAAATAPGHFSAIPKICVVAHCAVISSKNSELRGKNQSWVNYSPEWLKNTILGILTHQEQVTPSCEIPAIISFWGIF